MLPPEYKNVWYSLGFFFNSMGSKKTKSCFLTLSRLEQSATYQSIFRNLTKVVVPLSMCHRNLLKGGCHQCEVLIVYLEKARAGENISCCEMAGLDIGPTE